MYKNLINSHLLHKTVKKVKTTKKQKAAESYLTARKRDVLPRENFPPTV